MTAIDHLRSTLHQIAARLVVLGFESIVEFLAGQDLESIQVEYAETLSSVMSAYLDSDKPVTSFRNEIRRAINDAFTLAFIAGYADAGASGPLPDEAQSWLNSRIKQESGFADGLFSELKTLRADKEKSQDEKQDWISARASGYTGTLTGVYAVGKTYGDENIMGTWRLGATEEHCSTCSDLNGKRHSLKWFRDNDYIPQQSGSATLDCGGYHCLCTVEDDEGNQLLP